MAKNRGNTDFNLTATKTGTKSLRINRVSTNQEKVLTVQSAGDRNTIYSKRTQVHKTVAYFGEYIN
jgi:hypothetical protein